MNILPSTFIASATAEATTIIQPLLPIIMVPIYVAMTGLIIFIIFRVFIHK